MYMMMKEITAIGTLLTNYLLSDVATIVHVSFLLWITIIKFVEINTAIL